MIVLVEAVAAAAAVEAAIAYLLLVLKPGVVMPGLLAKQMVLAEGCAVMQATAALFRASRRSCRHVFMKEAAMTES